MIAFCEEKGINEQKLSTEKNVQTNLEMEMQNDDHLAIARLEEGVLDVVVHNVNLVTANRGEAETIEVSLQSSMNSFGDNVWTNEEVLQFGIVLVERQLQ